MCAIAPSERAVDDGSGKELSVQQRCRQWRDV